MKHVVHARKKRQLQYLVKRLERLLKNNRISTQSQAKPLIRKIKVLIKDLSGILTPFHLRRIIGSVAMALGISFSGQVSAQSFTAPQENPFGIIRTSEYIVKPAFADFDGDGDMDLIIGELYGYDDVTEFHYLENVGTALSPQFSMPQTNPFGLESPPFGPLLLTIADLDGDGDFDILASSINLSNFYVNFLYFENIGSSTVPQFAPAVENPYGLGLGSLDYIGLPAFADLDGDGVSDLLVTGFETNFLASFEYYENTGTPTAPQFETPIKNAFGLNSNPKIGYTTFPVFADLDNDGDQDLFGGIYEANMRYIENTGSANSPQFAEPVENPFGLVATDYYAIPAFADLDGDGDMDLFVGENYSDIQYFENISTVGTEDQYSDIQLDLYPNPVSSTLNLKMDATFEKIEIYDAMGKLINNYDGSVSTINVSAWNKGIYLFKFVDEQGQFTTRQIMKE